ncbi:hypothetical protein KDA00_05410 [Candidatus Saccharibacteria bacterium]|nr:hypothetical protein [Candidatus Saccharibacteria bacterium]
MTAQEYIQSKLDSLDTLTGINKPKSESELVDFIYSKVTSKKFRKYSLSPEASDHIKSSITKNVQAGDPIKATLVFGGYKIWRFEESPEVDWAELFSFMYYTNWMKPICEVYKPGVWYDFYSDDVIVPVINNVSPEDTKSYRQSFEQLLKFIKPYQPNNLDMTYNRVGDQYESFQKFQKDLDEQMKDLSDSLEGGYPDIDELSRSIVELNVKLTPEQETDPLWREKVQLTHDAYMKVSGRRPYYRTPDKFNIMTTPFNGMLSVGTTKDSIMKFWIGTGALKPKDDSFRQIILSPNQLQNANFTWQDIDIGKLKGKNFKRIRVLS